MIYTSVKTGYQKLQIITEISNLASLLLSQVKSQIKGPRF